MSELREQLIGIISLIVVALLGLGGVSAYAAIHWSGDLAAVMISLMLVVIMFIATVGYVHGRGIMEGRSLVHNPGDSVSRLLTIGLVVSLTIFASTAYLVATKNGVVFS